MSDRLRIVDNIKRHPTEELLTPTQRQIWESLCNLLQFPQRLNLCGPAGSGKTFVAWAVARTTGAIHVPIPTALYGLVPGNEILMIDNAPHDEDDVRRIMATCNLLEARSFILITRQPVTMPIRTLELTLPTAADIDVVIRTFGRSGYFAQGSSSLGSNLWTILSTCI